MNTQMIIYENKILRGIELHFQDGVTIDQNGVFHI